MTEHIENKGKTALMYACDKGNLKTIGKLIVDYKLDINAKDDKGITALMYAVINEQTHVIELLVKLGADQSIQDKDGYTALMHACKKKNKSIIEALLKDRKYRMPTFNDKLNIRAKDENGYTVLMHACKNGHDEMVDKLIAIIKEDIEQMVAKYEKDKKKYQKELDKYSDEYVENRNDDDKTTLIHAIENDNIKVIEKLLKLGIKQ